MDDEYSIYSKYNNSLQFKQSFESEKGKPRKERVRVLGDFDAVEYKYS